jgi:hypothetical protein
MMAIAFVSSLSFGTEAYQEERIETLHRDMLNYYGVFDKLSIKDKEYTSRLMHLTAEKILAYYRETQPSNLAYSEMAAEAQIILALAKYEVGDPTLTYHGIKSAQKINSGVLGKMDPQTGRSYSQMIDTVNAQWLWKFYRAEAKVNGFPENMIWDTVSVDLFALSLDTAYRGKEAQNAVAWANSYLNHELRKGSKDIILLLPLGEYRLETKNIEIFPTQFSVAKDKESIVFKIIPNVFFSLLFVHDVGPFYCDTIPPKDLNIWKGDRFVDGFDTLEFGIYEFRDSEKFKILDDYKFKRFIPEGEFIQWEVPDTTIYKIQDIRLRDKETYVYDKIGITRYFKRRLRPPPPPARKPTLISTIIDVGAAALVVYLFGSSW